MPDETAPAGDGVVQIAYLHNEHVSHSWHESMRAMLEYDLDHGRRIARKPLNLRCGSAIVSHVRNYAARLFLDKTDHEWLLFVDTDMGWSADAVHRLLDEAADPVQRPVVGALCFAAMEAAYDGMGGWRRTVVPTMYRIGTKEGTGEPCFCHYGPYEPEAVVPVAGTGAAFLLIHRSALEKVRADVGNHWFDMLYDVQDDIVGEDIAFCGRLLKAGIVPVVHTGVRTTHHKEFWISELDYLLQESTIIQPYPDIPLVINVEATVAALDGNQPDDAMWKLPADLERYERIIKDTRPEVIVETGTRTGASARWFYAHHGVREVITIDVNIPEDTAETVPDKGRVTYLAGSSTDPDMISGVTALVAGRRCMVSLDSAHGAHHVAREIAAYGPLVTAGCYLVVEDTIFGYDPRAKERHGMGSLDGSPLDAVAKMLVDNDEWSRDVAIERIGPTSSNPAGWWIRNA